MLRKTLKLQILSIILTVLMIGFSLLYILTSSELKKTIDEYQTLYYAEKIHTIVSSVNEKFEKLKNTDMVEAYEESFKKGTLTSIKKIYSTQDTATYPFVIDENRLFVVHPVLNNENRNSYISHKSFLRMIKMKEGSFTFLSKNKEKWVIFQYFEPWDWIIGYSVDVDTKYKEIEQYKKKFLITVFIILFVISILIILTVKYTLLPIERLIVASKRIAKGDLKSDIKINGSYELTQLSNSFSIMRDKIRTNIEELENANNQLEQKVDSRTIDLKNTISDLEKMQNQLVESEKIASLGALVAGVAHEINTPIGIGVTGISHFELISRELMKKYNDDNLSQEEFEEFIRVSSELASSVTTNLKRAADIIRSFKKVAVDRTSEEKREFNVKEYLEEILISLRNITKKTKHQYIIDCPKNLIISSYPGLFSQVITNFIMNSIIHAFKDNEAGKIRININQENSELNIQYSDNGCGISKENMKKIFNPFFTTNRKNGGSGLGLNIVHNIIVSQLKGTIKVESENENGTKFSIKIPL